MFYTYMHSNLCIQSSIITHSEHVKTKAEIVQYKHVYIFRIATHSPTPFTLLYFKQKSTETKTKELKEVRERERGREWEATLDRLFHTPVAWGFYDSLVETRRKLMNEDSW